MTPVWAPPSEDDAALVLGVLNSRKVVATHYLPSGVRIEVAYVGVPAQAWVVVWTGKAADGWPEECPECVLSRVEMSTSRQQTWMFLGDEANDWPGLLWEAWGLASDMTGGAAS